MNTTRLLFVAPFLLLAGGCCSAQVNILPKEAGQAQAVSTSSKESCALEKAQDRAAEYCANAGKHYVAVKQDSKYQGADPTAKMAVGALFGSKGDTSQDYRVTLDFKCE